MEHFEYAALAILAAIPILLAMIFVVQLAKKNRSFAAAALAVAVLFVFIPDPPPQFQIEESDPGEDDQGDPPEPGV